MSDVCWPFNPDWPYEDIMGRLRESSRANEPRLDEAMWRYRIAVQAFRKAEEAHFGVDQWKAIGLDRVTNDQLPQVIQILRDAQTLLTDPAKRTRIVFARDARGWPVMPRDASAVQWCVIGAVEHVAPMTASRTIRRAACEAAHDASGMYRESGPFGRHWADRDDCTHEIVMQAFAGAICQAARRLTP